MIKADNGDWNPLVELLATLLLSTISDTEVVAKEPARRSAWIGKLAAAAQIKEQESARKKYVVWANCITNGLLKEFRQCAGELNRSSIEIGVEIRTYDLPSQESWVELGRTPDKLQRLFALTFEIKDSPFYTVGFELRTHRENEADLFEYKKGLVGVFLTESDDSVPSNSYTDPHIDLREILFVDSNLYVYTCTAGKGEWQSQDDLTLGEVAEGLFTSVFLRKAGIGS